jgi:hypothetical protein
MKEIKNNQPEGKLFDPNVAWEIPNHLAIFIFNSIPIINETRTIVPWPEFKKIIFDFYDHRI